jgi:hypothetical protein
MKGPRRDQLRGQFDICVGIQIIGNLVGQTMTRKLFLHLLHLLHSRPRGNPLYLYHPAVRTSEKLGLASRCMNYSTVHDLTCIACCICTRWLFLPIVCQLHETLHPHPESETALRLGLFTPNFAAATLHFTSNPRTTPIQSSWFHPRPSSAVKNPATKHISTWSRAAKCIEDLGWRKDHFFEPHKKWKTAAYP